MESKFDPPTMFKGETINVERLSKSGKYAYGMAYGHVNSPRLD